MFRHPLAHGVGLMLAVVCMLFMLEWDQSGFTTPLVKPEATRMWEENAPLQPVWTRSYQLYGQPHALWLTASDAATNRARLADILKSAGQTGTVPEVVLYAIPQRDLNQASAGGFRSWTAYLAQSRQLAGDMAAFVKRTGIRPRLYLEPDSIAHAVQYLETHPGSPAARKLYEERLHHLDELVRLYKKAGVRVYLDAAHGGWFGHSPSAIEAMAKALNRAGVAEAEGITSNVSNRRKISDGAGGELAYLQRLVGRLAHPDPDVIVDTSRNGGRFTPREYLLAPDGALYDNELPEGRRIGSWARDGAGRIRLNTATGQNVVLSQLLDQQYQFDEGAMRLVAPEWLDPAGAVAPGPAPTDETGLAVIRRFRYIKPPDEADGALGYAPGQSRFDVNTRLAREQEGDRLAFWQRYLGNR